MKYNYLLSEICFKIICGKGGEKRSISETKIDYQLRLAHSHSSYWSFYLWNAWKFSCVWVLIIQSCPTLWDCRLPGSSVHGILQARILEGWKRNLRLYWDYSIKTMPFSRGSSDPGIKPASLMSPALAGGFFTTSATWEAPDKGKEQRNSKDSCGGVWGV